MTKAEAWIIARSEYPERVAALKARSYQELLRLAEYETVSVRYGEHELRWTTYRDLLEDQRLRIVVQLVMQTGTLMRFFQVSKVEADGFWIQPNGEVSPLPNEELYEFT